MVTATPAGMNDLLGTTAPIKFAPDPIDMNRPLTAAELDAAAELAEGSATEERLRSMAELVRAGGTVMPVEPEVAHAQEVGRREIRRRRARRKADAKRTPPGPPNPPKPKHHRPVA